MTSERTAASLISLALRMNKSVNMAGKCCLRPFVAHPHQWMVFGEQRWRLKSNRLVYILVQLINPEGAQ